MNTALKTPSADPLPLDNDIKIRFCNAYVRLSSHLLTCPKCRVYINHGDGDLCPWSKDTLAMCLT